MGRPIPETSLGVARSISTLPHVISKVIYVAAAAMLREPKGIFVPERHEISEGRRLLGNCPLFAGLSATERAAIAARARIRSVATGEMVFAIGSPGDEMMAVLSGTIRISVPSPDGKELVLAMIKEGEVFGELSVLDGKERSADAVAESACTLAILDRRDMLAFFERNPSAWLKLVKVLCERLRRTDQIFAEVALLQLPSRLAKMMLRVTQTSGAGQSSRIRFSQRELASMVGGTRESVNRCLSKWQSSGIIQISEGAIVIMERAALEAIAEPP
jgi:CRP/FNR family transcriptional regulator, cyclic AMP receptor protein